MTTTLVHPWTSHRRDLGLTQSQLADRMNVSRHYVIRSEQALFAQPPPRVLEELAKLLEPDRNSLVLTRDRLRKEYYEYQRLTRLRFAETYQNWDGLYDYQGKAHPLVYWREIQSLSRIGLCKGLCLHQDMVRDYELNKQRHIPEQLTQAAHLIKWDVEPLVGAVASWRIRWR